jgi:hypothetical protein
MVGVIARPAAKLARVTARASFLVIYLPPYTTGVEHPENAASSSLDFERGSVKQFFLPAFYPPSRRR